MSDVIGNQDCWFHHAKDLFYVMPGITFSFPPGVVVSMTEPLREKTNNLGFRLFPTQASLYSHRRRLEA